MKITLKPETEQKLNVKNCQNPPYVIKTRWQFLTKPNLPSQRGGIKTIHQNHCIYNTSNKIEPLRL
ncbi:hypothetical protein [uncultured Methanobrevibacter sp.]|uniref:hypothetical protein n=1 Tax=uncultured Methanobrevibacter sp. TaxID=253161 RepID=UPI002631EDFE|nr:hypothetical protein [uncultured Methanobrevibacter sp.]